MIPDFSWVRETKVIEASLGYADQSREDATKALNQHLLDGWRLLCVMSDTKSSNIAPSTGATITSVYYLIGK